MTIVYLIFLLNNVPLAAVEQLGGVQCHNTMKRLAPYLEQDVTLECINTTETKIKI